jgi:hypothetical protein
MKLTLTTIVALSLCGQLYAAGDTAIKFELPGQSSRQLAGRAKSAPTPAPVERIFYARTDGTQVYQKPDTAGGESNILAELRGGERVKVLGRAGNYYNVSVNRRDYDPKSGKWGNTQGWVSVNSVGENVPAADTLTIPMEYQQMEPSGCRAAFIEKLKGFSGVPYVWGGTSHRGVDCSGLVVAAMLEAGCMSQTPPRTARDQQRAATRLDSADKMQPGDLIFSGEPAHHVVILVEKDQNGGYTVIEAPNRGNVVNTHSWQPQDKNTFGALLD